MKELHPTVTQGTNQPGRGSDASSFPFPVAMVVFGVRQHRYATLTKFINTGSAI